jgi:hypothetical protein
MMSLQKGVVSVCEATCEETHDKRSGTGSRERRSLSIRLLVELLLLRAFFFVPSTECLLRSAFCGARDYERGTTTATVAGCVAAAVVGCDAVALLVVVLGAVVAVVVGAVRYTGVPSPNSDPPDSGSGCPEPRYCGVFPPSIAPLPNAIPHCRW